MFREDYIIRQINQLAQVLSRVLSAILKKSTQKEELSFDEVNTLLDDNLSLSIDRIIELSDEELLKYLLEHDFLTLELIGQLGDILYEIAQLDPEEQYSQKALYKKGLLIYHHFESTSEIFSIDRHLRAQEIKEKLDSL